MTYFSRPRFLALCSLGFVMFAALSFYSVQGAEPKEITNSLGMKLTLIPAGSFQMGSPNSEEDRDDDEGPRHRVQLKQSFYLGVYEVTQSEYEQLIGSNPSYYSSEGGGSEQVRGKDTSRFPVESVSWEDAIEFCKKLSAKEGHTYRLPTEAEWEYACRAGTTTPFHFGSRLNGDKANVKGTSPYGTEENGPYLKRPTTVVSYSPNAFGLYDMHGNVWEWCQDWYETYYYRKSPSTDPTGPSSGSSRVLRGGSWLDGAHFVRSAGRIRNSPDYRYHHVGFRLVRVSE